MRAARGWSRHHYATVGATVILLIMAFGLLMPAVPKARNKEHDVDRAYKQIHPALVRAAEDMSTSPSTREPPREVRAVKTSVPQTFTDPKNRFSVTFPEAPVLRPPSGEAANGLAELAIWVAREGDTKYLLSALYAPVELLDATFDLDQLAGPDDNPDWRVVTRREVTLDGQPGKQVEHAAANGIGASVSVFARYRGTVVALSVNGRTGVTSESKGAKAFFESFRFRREGTRVGE